MTKRAIAIYTLAATLFVFSYLTMRGFLILLPYDLVIISNLTLNYILLAFISGGLAGWYLWNRAFRRHNYVIRFVGTVFGSLLASGLWIVIMSAGGMHMRWG